MVEWRGQNWASGYISQGYVKNRSHSYFKHEENQRLMQLLEGL